MEFPLGSAVDDSDQVHEEAIDRLCECGLVVGGHLGMGDHPDVAFPLGHGGLL
jgi:hypothetical protein